MGGPSVKLNRLRNPADPVRVEIEIALRAQKPLIPVLVSRAVMPSPEELPESLHDFAYRNAVEVDGGRDFDVHVTRLIHEMERILGGEEARTTSETVRSPPGPAQVHPPQTGAAVDPQSSIVPAPENVSTSLGATESRSSMLGEAPLTAIGSIAIPATRSIPGARPERAVWLGGVALFVAIFSAGAWWFAVEQPVEMSKPEATAADKAKAEEQARQEKALQDEAARRAADKAQQDAKALPQNSVITSQVWRGAVVSLSTIASTLFTQSEISDLDQGDLNNQIRKALERRMKEIYGEDVYGDRFPFIIIKEQLVLFEAHPAVPG